MSSHPASIIDIRNIINAFRKSVEGFEWLFYIVPIVFGILLPIVLYGVNAQTTNVLVSFLTSFVPLFATILTFYLSWCYNKIKTRHNTERLSIFRETSTDILMMIPLDVAALLCSILSNIRWLQSCHLPTFEGQWNHIDSLFSSLAQFTWHQGIRYLFLTLFYGFTTEIILIMLMVCKRAYVIIINEIVLISEESNNTSTAEQAEEVE